MNELKKIKQIKLTDFEKRDIFNRLSSSISKENSTVKLNYPVRSPFFKFPFFSYNRYLQVGILSVFVLLLAGTTAFASLDALPGDLLYDVKVNIVEKIPNLLPLSPESRAKNNSDKIEERINELEKLAKKGKLTDQKVKKIEENIQVNLDNFDKNIKDIKKTTEGNKEKNTLETELNTELEKHVEKIKKIRAEDKNSDTKTLQSVLERNSFFKKQNKQEQEGRKDEKTQ